MQTDVSVLARLDAQHPLLVDGLLAAVLLCFAEVHVLSGAAPGSAGITAPAAVAIAGAVAVRRSAPLAAIGIAAAGVVFQSLFASPPQALWLIATVLVLSFSVGVGLPRWPALFGLLIAFAAMLVDEAAASDRSFSGFVFVAFLVGLPWFAGRAVYARQHRAETFEARATRLEREREEDARAAVAAERARIARELHDIVAHAVSVIVVKAEAADAVLDEQPDLAHAQLGAIQHTGRQAIAEMGRLLGMLRQDGAADELAPQPGLGQLDTLFEQLRSAGLSAAIEIHGEPRPLAPGVDLAAYRIVQEALTNALKHAGPDAAATVAVDFTRNALAIQITDNGRGSNGAAGGHGLIGMRERVALYGGTLEAGPGPGGGFRVAATLPLDPDEQ